MHEIYYSPKKIFRIGKNLVLKVVSVRPYAKFMFDLTAQPIPKIPPGLPEATLFRVEKQDDIGSVKKIMKSDVTMPDNLKERLSKGDVYFAFTHNNSTASFGWLATSKKSTIDLIVKKSVPKGSVYIGNCYTDPKFRGKNLYTSMLSTMLHYAKDKKNKRVYITCGWHNIASKKGIIKSGFTFQKKIHILKLLKFNFVF